MCDERERLIGFVYDEVDSAERRAVEAHLADCPDCRQEVGGLRQARQDLLAWDVPAHEPIWRPMPIARREVGWRQVPAWAMAAAASAVLAAGLVGAMATRWFMPAATAAVVTAGPPAPAMVPVVVSPAVASAVTADEVAAIEARLVARLRGEMQAQLKAASGHQTLDRAPVVATRAGLREGGQEALVGRLAEFEQRLDEFDEWRDRQIEANWSVNNRLAGLNTQARSLGDDWAYLLQRVNMTSGPNIGR
jgi:anti-sigma factor RsiW